MKSNKSRRNNIYYHNTSPNSTPSSDTESGSAAAARAGSQSPTREQDRFLPIANVSRIMKRSLPANAKISKEAKETVQVFAFFFFLCRMHGFLLLH